MINRPIATSHPPTAALGTPSNTQLRGNVRGSIQYKLQSLDMFQKNSQFCLFSSCYEINDKQNKCLQTSIKLKCTSNRKEPKVSLKRSQPNSTRSKASSTPMKDLSREESPLLATSKKSSVDWQLDNLHLPFHQPSHQKISLSSKKSRVLALAELELPPTKKLVQFKYLSQNESSNLLQLQKTTRLRYLDKDKVGEVGNKQKSNGSQAKQLNKEHFITSLSTNKQSMVSIHVENENCEPKVQESAIMINYFHPPSSKIMEIDGYLSQRT